MIDLLGGGVRRAGCCCWSAPGDNGGDALYAGALLARRGRAGRGACCCPTSAHEAGLAALRAAGGRVGRPRRRRRRPDVVVDGIVGIGGRPGLRPERRRPCARRRGRPGRRGRHPERRRRRHRRARRAARARRRHRHLRHPQDLPPGRPGRGGLRRVQLVDIGLDLPGGRGRGAPGRRRRGPAAAAGRRTRRSTPAAWSASAPARAQLPRRRRCSASPARPAGSRAWSGTSAGARRRGSARPTPRSSSATGRVQAWVVGSGGGADGGRRARRGAATTTYPLVVDADALAHLDGPLDRPALLTPHAGELAAMLGVDRAEIEADRSRFARRAAARVRRAVLLKGRHTLVAAPDGRVRVDHHRHRLAGDRRRRRRARRALIGALLAAGLDAVRRRRRSAPGCTAPRRPCAARGGPISAPAGSRRPSRRPSREPARAA